MVNRHYSLHKIHYKDSLSFLPKEYSKFKFGCKTIAKNYGYQLAEGFISSVLGSGYAYRPSNDQQIVVVSSPYCFIPTATFAMKDYFVQKLNNWLCNRGINPVQETKIHRTITYKEDYGALSAEQRLNLIKNDSFHIDKEFIKDKFVLFLDDIKITGSHEIMVQNMVNKYELKCDYMFLYFAELADKSIDPNIENYLNYYYVKSLLHLDKIIKNENFMLNTRVVKYILCAPYEEFKSFIQYQSVKLVTTIYHLAIGNSYHLIEDYKKNLDYIKQLIKK